MSDSFSRKRPSFSQFRDWFMKVVNRHVPRGVTNPFTDWHAVGDVKTRQAIVESFMQELEQKYGFRPVIKEDLAQFEGHIESVSIQIFHVFSTMFLVDHINAKMYKQKASPVQ